MLLIYWLISENEGNLFKSLTWPEASYIFPNLYIRIFI